MIEAASMGTPTVGYNVEGLKDSIQHMKTGLLVDDNYESLAQGIEMLMENKKLYQKMSDASVVWSKKFDWNKSAVLSYRMLRKIYER